MAQEGSGVPEVAGESPRTSSEAQDNGVEEVESRILDAQFVYHARDNDWDELNSYIHGRLGSTLGFKVTVRDANGVLSQYGAWNFLEEDTPAGIAREATALARKVLIHMPLLREGVARDGGEADERGVSTSAAATAGDDAGSR